MPQSCTFLLVLIGGLLITTVCELHLNIEGQRHPELPKRRFRPLSHDANEPLLPRKMNAQIIQKFLTVLNSASPQHHPYVLYDDNFTEILSLVAFSTMSMSPTTIAKISPEVLDLNRFLYHPLTYSTTSRLHILVFTSMENLANLFTEVSRRNLESPLIWWIVIVQDKEAKGILQGILREGSQVIVVEITDQELFQIYCSKVDNDGSIKFNQAATWESSSDSSLNTISPEIFVNLDQVYSDFQGRQLTVTANQWKPFVSMIERDDGELELESGIDAAMIETMSQVLNFSIRMVTTEDGAWGVPLEDGTVNGMVGMVYRREAHFAACELTISHTRETIIDFTYPYYIEIFTLVSPAPKEKGRTFAVFSSFTDEVWLGIAALTVINGLLLYVLKLMSSCYTQDKTQGYTVNNLLFNVYRSLTKQENMLTVRTVPFKVSFTFWYFFSLIITTYYSSMLIATLVKPSFEKPIESLSDLPEALQNGFTFAIPTGGLTEEMFKEAEDGIYADTWKLLLSQGRAKSFYDDFNAIQDKILSDRMIITRAQTVATYTVMQKGARLFHIAREPITSDFYGIACFSGAPFQSKFSQKLLHMVQGGLVTKWANNEFMKVVGKSIVENTGLKPFTLEQLQAAFYILALGCLVSASAFGVEVLSACRHQ